MSFVVWPVRTMDTLVPGRDSHTRQHVKTVKPHTHEGQHRHIICNTVPHTHQGQRRWAQPACTCQTEERANHTRAEVGVGGGRTHVLLIKGVFGSSAHVYFTSEAVAVAASARRATTTARMMAREFLVGRVYLGAVGCQRRSSADMIPLANNGGVLSLHRYREATSPKVRPLEPPCTSTQSVRVNSPEQWRGV